MIQFIAQVYLLLFVVYCALVNWHRGGDVDWLRSTVPLVGKQLPDDVLVACFRLSGILATLTWLAIYYAAGAFSKILEL